MSDPNVLVGAEHADDAGVYRITDDLAAVLTADFFTPIVDDPYSFGSIAAANALSDVYAMGGRPLVSLNIAALPSGPDFADINRRIMQGGIDKMTEAGVIVIGGHTVKDKEPKFGYAVLGTIHPGRIYDNTKGRPGDALILTKRIGTGIIATGLKAGSCSRETEEEFMRSMTALNKRAGEIMVEVEVSTATDITGFGLIGHLNEVLTASGCAALLHAGRVPYLTGAVLIAEKGLIPGGTRANERSYASVTEWGSGVTPVEKALLNDAQTSGGLLIFVPQAKKERLVAALEKEGILAAHIGNLLDEVSAGPKRVFVEK